MGNLKVLYLFVFVLLWQGIQTALFKDCDHVFYISPGVSYLESPYYPRFYPANTSCRYKFKAAVNYGIDLKCSLNLPHGYNPCSDFLYIARDGDLQLRGSEQLCGIGYVTRKSLANTITVAYISGGDTGKFNCSLYVRRQPCDCGWSVNTKIVNGEDVKPNEYPSIVALRDRTSSMPLFCSGNIISERFILTAAHCAKFQPNPAVIDCLVGRQNIESATDTIYADIYYIRKMIIHPYYSPEPTRNDIALLETTYPIEFRKGVGPICLPPISNINNNFAYEDVVIAGWGSKVFAGPISATLQEVSLVISDQDTCVAAFQGRDNIYSSHICTYDFTGKGKDSCQFDSGGGVMYRHLSRLFLIGIISFGKHCGAQGYAMGVNERITYHLPWILENTGGTTCYIEI